MPCIVCGDKAQGINFNALTCMSCKTFFRRNALREKEFKCNFNNCCSMTPITRKFCTKCRLQKCFDVGMQRELIQTDKRKTINKMRFIISQLRRESSLPQLIRYEQISEFSNNNNIHQQNSSNSSLCESSSLSPSSPLSSSSSSSPAGHVLPASFDDCNQSNDSMIHLPESICEIIEANHNFQHNELEEDVDDDFINHTFDSLTAEEIYELQTFKTDLKNYLKQQNSNLELIDLIEDCQVENLQNIQKFHFHSCSKTDELDQTQIQDLKHQNLDYISQCLMEIDQDDDDEYYSHDPIIDYIFQIKHKNSIYPEIYLPTHELQSGEANALKELITACKVLKNPYKQYRHLTYADTQTCHQDKVSRFTLQRLIQMSSQLNSFAQLCASDQIAMLQLNLLDMMAVQMALMFNRDQNCWSMVDDKNKMTVLVPFGHLKVKFDNIINYDRNLRFISLFREEWKSDDVIFNLLTVIVLFNPREEFYEYDKIKNQHVGYIRLLNRYLNLKYPQPEEAKASFELLMNNLEELHQICVEIRRMFQDKFRIDIQNSPFFAELLRACKINSN